MSNRDHTSRPAEMDALEERRLLSVGLSKGGTLSVVGTKNNDVIYLTMRRHDRTKLDVVVNGTVSTVNAARVKNIIIEGGRRDDNVKIDDRNGRVVGRHVEHGGDGDDSLTGDLADDSLLGEAGDDSLFGNGGDDSLDGGIGDDSLDGGTGEDHVHGGRGRDHFHGNNDDDDEIDDHGGDDVNDDHGGGGGGGGDDDLPGDDHGGDAKHHSLIATVRLRRNVFAT